MRESAKTVDTNDMQANRCSAARRHYLTLACEGGLFVGGMQFLSIQLVLPALVIALGGSQALVGWLPSLCMLGLVLPPLVLAQRIDRMSRVKNAALCWGLIQRLPYLCTAVLLLLWGADYPELLLICVVLTPILSNLVGGIGYGLYWQLIRRLVAPSHTASMFSLRQFIGAVLSVALVGPIISAVLNGTSEHEVLPYAILHMCVFIMLMLSWLCLFLLDDRSAPNNSLTELAKSEESDIERCSWRTYLRMFRDQRNLRLAMLGHFFGNGFLIMMPFFSPYAVQKLDVGAELTGSFVQFFMLGAVVANAVGAWLGDRYGARILLLLAHGLMLVIGVGFCLAEDFWSFALLFMCNGMALTLQQTGLPTLGVELAAPNRVAAVVALLAVAHMPGLLLAGILAGALGTTDYLVPVVVTGACFLICAQSCYHLMHGRDVQK